MDRHVLFIAVGPGCLGVVFVVIILLRNRGQPVISSGGRNLVILFGEVLPFLTLLFVCFLLLLDKFFNLCFIIVEVSVLIDSEVSMVAGDL